MTAWLADVMGLAFEKYVVAFLDVMGVFFYYVLLSWYKKRRRFYFLRLAGVLLLQLLLGFPCAYLRYYFDNNFIRIVNGTIQGIVFLSGLFFCYDESPPEILQCFAGIYATRVLSSNLFSLLLNIFGVDSRTTISFWGRGPETIDWVIYWAIQVTLALLIYLFLRKQEKLRETNRNMTFAFLLALAAYAVGVVLSGFVSEYESQNFQLGVCCKTMLVIISVFILVMRAGLLNGSRIQHELAITEQLLYQEKRHYAEMKDNIDAINAKCHDIKHQLEAFHDKLTDSELSALQEAIRIYDSNIKTGNEILDTLLYQKQLYCDKNGIELSCLANGALLSFISATDLYSLLSNAIDNAIEAVSAVENEKKKTFGICIGENDGNVSIEVTNYFNREAAVVADTSKRDKSHHGFGIKSMRFIAKKYNGTLTTETEDDIFYLRISIPIAGN